MWNRCYEKQHPRGPVEATAEAGETDTTVGEGASVYRSPALVYSSAQDLISLTGILHYGRELNRSQGVGFTLWNRRISSKLVIGLLCKGLLLFPLSFVLIEGIVKQEFAQLSKHDGANVQTGTRDALSPALDLTVAPTFGNSSNATSNLGDYDRAHYYQMFGWVVLLFTTILLLAACGAIVECNRLRHRGQLVCDRPKLRDVERTSRLNWFGIEPE